jgi:hypothetical protein
MRCADFRVFSLRVQGPQPLPHTAQVILPWDAGVTPGRWHGWPVLIHCAAVAPAIEKSAQRIFFSVSA